MEDLFYCCNCCAMIPTRVIEKEQTFNVKGREITLRAPVRICNECGEEILDRDLDNNTLNRFYEEYRRLEKSSSAG